MKKLFPALFLSVILSLPASALVITAEEGGISIDGGGPLRLRLQYPQLASADNSKVWKIQEKNIQPTRATLRFEGGTKAVLTVVPEKELQIEIQNAPANLGSLRFVTHLSFNLINGCQFQFDDRPMEPFPTAKPAHPHLYQGMADQFSLQDEQGNTLALSFPEKAFQQLTDNREWNWKMFGWKLNLPYRPKLTLHMRAAAPAQPRAHSVVQVDRFGQNAQRDWPDKVKTEEELRDDIEKERQFIASLNMPQFDPYGGLPGSGEKYQLHKTGYFHLEKKGDKWFMVDPEGNLFFHLGVGSFQPSGYTFTGGRRHIYEWLPALGSEYKSAFLKESSPDDFDFHSANLIRKFGRPVSKPEFVERMIDRVRAWGFNSSGPFTGVVTEVLTRKRFPYVTGLPINSWDGFETLPGIRHVPDPFDQKLREKFDQLCAAKIPPNADDPLLIGYFLENEPIYEDIPRLIPTLRGSEHPCKRRLVQFLQEKYSSIARFNEAWKMEAASFEALTDQGMSAGTPAASADMQDYYSIFMEEYFSWMAATFRKYDKNHMLIGNRLQLGTINNPAINRIMGKYLDVISFNYYTYATDTDLLRKLYSWSGRPMILSEFYWDSPADSGLPGGVKDVGSQKERGLAYRNYVETAAALDFIVGVEWFNLVDQPLTGNWFSKYNGENGNTGLVSVTDRPWRVMLEQMIATNYEIYPVALGEKPPFVLHNPRYQKTSGARKVLKLGKTTGPMIIDGSAENWPALPAEPIGGRIVQGADGGNLDGSFKVCWNDEFLFILADMTDPTPMRNEQSGPGLWQGDCLEIFVGPATAEAGGALLREDRQILLGVRGASGQAPTHVVKLTEQPEIQVAVKQTGAGYSLEAAIPFSALGIKPETGAKIRFDLGVDDSEDGKDRQRQLMWNGVESNSVNRDGWGEAVFLN